MDANGESEQAFLLQADSGLLNRDHTEGKTLDRRNARESHDVAEGMLSVRWQTQDQPSRWSLVGLGLDVYKHAAPLELGFRVRASAVRSGEKKEASKGLFEAEKIR